MLMEKMMEMSKSRNQTRFHMERQFNGTKRFWRIQMRKRSTIVTTGRVGFLGRVYLPRKHKSLVEMIKFVRKQIKLKRKRRYVLKRNTNKAGQQRRAKKESKPGKPVKTQNRGRKAVRKTQKTVTVQSSVKQRKIASEANTETVKLPVKYNLLKNASLTVGASAYVPPKGKWPLNISAPVPWNYKSQFTSYGVYVDDNHCIFSNDNGQIMDFSAAGKLQRMYQLPDGVRCLTKDGEFLYAGCNDGGLYDLTHGEARLMCQIESFSGILWMDVNNGMICASDADGHIALLNYEGEVIWKHLSKGMSGWMARIDGDSVYHGNSSGVTRYAVSDGKKLWERKTGQIYFGVQTENFIYAAERSVVQKLDKKTGATIRKYTSNCMCLCNEVGDGLVFVPSAEGIVCFDDNTGETVYQLIKQKQSDVDLSIPMSMHYDRGRLYCVGNQFYVIDLTEESIKQTLTGKLQKPVSLVVNEATKVMHPLKQVESISQIDAAAEGVIVHCIKEGGKLRMRPLSKGYHPNWNCQFPREIRREGAHYSVERLITAPGSFYRAFGTIKQINS